VPKTLLAVDDSATMRKVLEITFGGEDFRVVTADGATTALSRLGEEPVAAVIDTSLGSDDGYALAKEMRARDGRLALVIMASRYAPYDANRGRDAGVDDYIDKPFDTQALIEKVKKALLTRETREAAKPAPAPVPAPAASTFAASHVPRAPGAPAAAAGLPGAAVPNKAAFPNQRTHTLSFEGGLPIVPPPAARPAPAPTPAAGHPPAPAPAAPAAPAPVAQHVPATALPRQPVAAAPPAAPPAPAPAPAAPVAHAPIAAIAAAANGQLAGKLGDLGLTSVQADAVLALSREVIERVVWEVVPQLAEALIKEEIARLTRD
jgi:CheY-like chemotaxis protein